MYYYVYESICFVCENAVSAWEEYKVSFNVVKSTRFVYIYERETIDAIVYAKLQPHHFFFQKVDSFDCIYGFCGPELSPEQSFILERDSSALNRCGVKDYSILKNLYDFVIAQNDFGRKKNRIHILGLGDVGSIFAIGLKLLGNLCIDTIGVYDLSENQRQRWAIELKQISINEEMNVEPIEQAQLFDCDAFVFCASVGVPAVGAEGADVRMVQFAGNRKLISQYVDQAVAKQFKGLFCIVSDPVDLLCRAAYEASNGQLRPEQIRGYGLGVMDARALYYGKLMGIDYRKNGRVYGPHGKGLIVANDISKYDPLVSQQLTEKVLTANLAVRALGFKPFIAPALSSGAKAIIATLEGQWHYSAVFTGGVYWGSFNKIDHAGQWFSYDKVSPDLLTQMKLAHQALEEQWEEFK